MKSEFKDGIWRRNTYYDRCQIELIGKRDRYGWVIEARSGALTAVVSSSQTSPLKQLKKALRDIRGKIRVKLDWFTPDE